MFETSKSKNIMVLASVIAVGTLSQQSMATSIFVLDDTTPAFSPISTDGLNDGDVVTVDGIDLAFSNVVVSDGSAIGDVEGVGILISGEIDPTYTDVISFDFSFSQDVQLQTYDIGTWEDVPASSYFTISGPNGTSGNNIIPPGTFFTEQKYNFDSGTIPFFQAGSVYSFTHNLADGSDALFNLEELVVRLIPEPSAGLLTTLGCVVYLRGRPRR